MSCRRGPQSGPQTQVVVHRSLSAIAILTLYGKNHGGKPLRSSGEDSSSSGPIVGRPDIFEVEEYSIDHRYGDGPNETVDSSQGKR